MNVGPVGYPIHMSRRLNNCKACKGCHTGRGGQFVSPGGTKRDSPTDMAMLGPDRDIPEYESYLAEKIAEEEEHLKTFQDKCRVSIMEEKLARLRLQTTELDKKSLSDCHEGDSSADTGVAVKVLYEEEEHLKTLQDKCRLQNWVKSPCQTTTRATRPLIAKVL